MQQTSTRLSTATDIDEHTGSQGESTDDQMFSEVVSRKKRRRTRSNLQQQQQNDHQATATRSSRATPITSAKPRPGGPLIIDKLSNNNISMNLSAQKFVAAKSVIMKRFSV